MFYDIFNGDADGICALHQLRLAKPQPAAQLITGVKRDIRLLKRISTVKNATVTVFDISMDSNREELLLLLNNGCTVLYFDHHFVDSIPDSPSLNAYIDPDPNICTSLIVDRLLEGKYRSWAIVGAYGDNLHDAAKQAAASLSVTEEQLASLKELGELLNYNGYGPSIADLHFPPQTLYNALSPFIDPLDFFYQSDVPAKLKEGYLDDMAQAKSSVPLLESKAGRVFKLPAEPWARRVSGVFSNEKARQKPELAHAILIENQDGGTYRISVRAPLNNKIHADRLCLRFPTGGGRAAAAGINALPAELLTQFLNSFEQVFQP